MILKAISPLFAIKIFSNFLFALEQAEEKFLFTALKGNILR